MKIEYITKTEIEQKAFEITGHKLAKKIIIKESYHGDALTIEFYDEQGNQFYHIGIHPTNISITQRYFRPNHDHDDNPQFLIVDGKPGWYDRIPNGEIERLPFGKVIVDY